MGLPPAAWIGQLSRRFPEARIEVLARLEIEKGKMLTDLRITLPESHDWATEIGSAPTVLRTEQLGDQGDAALVRVVHTSRGFLPILAKLQILRQFPFPIVNGHATWTVVCRESRLRRLVQGLERSAPDVTVEAIHSHFTTNATDGLTPRQREIFQRAMSLGYFEVPRHLTLTELADRLGVSKSTLSEALAIIERKILRELALGEPT